MPRILCGIFILQINLNGYFLKQPSNLPSTAILYSSYVRTSYLSERICKRRCNMSDRLAFLNKKNVNSDWLTIKEAVKASKNKGIRKIQESVIYRYALQGKVLLSIYFQSPITLRKIKSYNHKLKLKPKDNNLPDDKIMLNKLDFFSESNLTFSTKGKHYSHCLWRH